MADIRREDLRKQVNRNTAAVPVFMHERVSDAEFDALARAEGYVHRDDPVDVRMVFAFEAGRADERARWRDGLGVDVDELREAVKRFGHHFLAWAQEQDDPRATEVVADVHSLMAAARALLALLEGDSCTCGEEDPGVVHRFGGLPCHSYRHTPGFLSHDRT